MADEDAQRERFNKISAWILNHVAEYVDHMAATVERLGRYMHIKFQPHKEMPTAQKHALFKTLDTLTKARNQIRVVEATLTGGNFEAGDHAPALFTPGVDKFDLIIDAFLTKSEELCNAVDDATQGFNLYTANVDLPKDPQLFDELTRKQYLLFMVDKILRVDNNLTQMELWVINRFRSPPQQLVQEFLKLKGLHDNGFMGDDEYDLRRIAIVEKMIEWSEGRTANDPIMEPLAAVGAKLPPAAEHIRGSAGHSSTSTSTHTTAAAPRPAVAPASTSSPASHHHHTSSKTASPSTQHHHSSSASSQTSSHAPPKEPRQPPGKRDSFSSSKASSSKPSSPSVARNSNSPSTGRHEPRSPAQPRVSPASAAAPASNVSPVSPGPSPMPSADSEEPLWFPTMRGQEAPQVPPPYGYEPEPEVVVTPVEAEDPDWFNVGKKDKKKATSPQGSNMETVRKGLTPSADLVVDSIFRNSVDARTAAPAKLEPAGKGISEDTAETKVSKTFAGQKKPTHMTVISPKFATPGQRLTIQITVDNPTSRKINCIQLVLQNQAKRDIDTQAVYPSGLPIVQTQWSGTVNYSVPTTAYTEPHFLCIDAVGKKGDELRACAMLTIMSKGAAWQSSTTQIFETPIDEAVKRDKADIPRIVTACVNYLRKRGVADLEGIFRISGSTDKINQIRQAVDSGLSYDINSIDQPHTVAGILKLYIRSLPEPLLSFAYYDSWIKIADMDNASQVQRMREVLTRVSPASRALIKYFFTFLAFVESYGSSNKMTAENLAIVFGPVVLRRKQESPEMLLEMPKANMAVKALILSAAQVFDD